MKNCVYCEFSCDGTFDDLRDHLISIHPQQVAKAFIRPDPEDKKTITVGRLAIQRWLTILGMQQHSGGSGLLVEERANDDVISGGSGAVASAGESEDLGGKADGSVDGGISRHSSIVLSGGSSAGKETEAAASDVIGLGGGISGKVIVPDDDGLEGLEKEVEQMWPNNQKNELERHCEVVIHPLSDSSLVIAGSIETIGTHIAAAGDLAA